jgi:hypothetical protein
MSRAGPLKDLGVCILIITPGRWLDSIDDIIHYSVVALSPPKVVLLTSITIIITVVTVIVVAIITTPIIAPVIGAAI